MIAHTAKVVIIGSGFSGIGFAHKLREMGIEDFVILERSGDVGGVWNLNTYPGCNCDVPSHLYSFSFAPNPEWTSTYSPQPEIRDYLRTCVNRFGLQAQLRTGVEVTGATWVEAEQRWRIDTSDGEWSAQVLVSAVGPLTEPKLPDVPGMDRFQGKVMHSARWDNDYDLTGKRVASIGTGASAIQYVPRIADEVNELFVFQRSAPWIMPHDKRPITETERQKFRAHPSAQRRERNKVYLSKEILILGFVKHPKLMRLVQGLSRKHLEHQVKDPALRAAHLRQTSRSAANGLCRPTSGTQRYRSQTSPSSPTLCPKFVSTPWSTRAVSKGKLTPSSSALGSMWPTSHSRTKYAVATAGHLPRSGKAAPGRTSAPPSRAFRTISCSSDPTPGSATAQ